MTDRALFRKTFEGLLPANNEGKDFYDRIKLGEIVELKGVKVRNGQYHRLFFAMLRLVSENSNPPISEAAALHFAKMATGTGEFVTDSRGREVFVPGSISFARMDQNAFKDFVQTAIPPLVARFMAGTAPDDLIAEAMSLAA